MRIYSDKILTWIEILHASYSARIYSGKLNNKYTYKIQCIRPTMLHTFSPIEFLEQNRKYYLYEYLIHNKLCDNLPNFIDIVESVNNKPLLFNNDYKIYLPLTVAVGDTILIHEDTYCGDMILA